MDQVPDDVDVTVTVVRSGGFAGLRRQWVAAPPPADRPRWVALIDDCPWDEVASGDEAPRGDADADGAPTPPPAADRFVWRIDVRRGADERDVRLPETRLHGPWRQLVDEVQAFEEEREGTT